MPALFRITAPAILAAFVLSGCGEFSYPRDPDHTLQTVLATNRMRVVAVEHPPWVVIGAGGMPTGAEVELVEAFASELGAKIEWREAVAFRALEALEQGDADLAVGGFTREAVEAHAVTGHTYSYFTETLLVAAEPGTLLPRHLSGDKVYAAPELMAEGLIEDEGGTPISQMTENVELVALPDWRLPERDLVITGIELRRNEHVMAIPKGENAWLLRLDHFLRRHEGEVAALLREHAP